MPTPTYTPELLKNLIWQTKSIEDHAKLIKLYEALHEQGDINFDANLKAIIGEPKHYFRFVNKIDNMEALCAYNLRLVDLQQKGYAVVTCMLARRISFQRELIIAKNKH